MPDKNIKQLAEIIQNRDRPDQVLLRENNIAIGLRDDQGAGIIVGATTKGCVTGYARKYLASIKGDEDSSETNTFVVDPSEIYIKLYGVNPNPEQLESFIPKLRSILPSKLEPLEGKLSYCGIDIKEIANAHKTTFGFEEVSYLLLTGELPNMIQLKNFDDDLKSRRILPVGFRDKLTYQLTSRDLMNTLQTAVDNLYELDPNPNSTNIEDVTRHSLELIAKFPSLVAYSYQGLKNKYDGKGLSIVLPEENLSHAEAFMKMLRCGDNFTKEEAKILDLFLMLHADHGGGNNSTFTVRVVSSSETDTYSAISSGLASLKGHLHGGANEKVMGMMKDIKENVKDWKDNEEVFNYLGKILRKEAGDKSGKIYGVGHAVYTKSDPRAIILRDEARKLALSKDRLGEFELLDLVGNLAPKAFENFKGSKKIVSANVDFYSGFVLDSLQIPSEIYTPLFAMARVSGWAAHRLEQLVQNRIIRPAYFELFPEKAYVPLEQR